METRIWYLLLLKQISSLRIWIFFLGILQRLLTRILCFAWISKQGFLLWGIKSSMKNFDDILTLKQNTKLLLIELRWTWIKYQMGSLKTLTAITQGVLQQGSCLFRIAIFMGQIVIHFRVLKGLFRCFHITIRQFLILHLTSLWIMITLLMWLLYHVWIQLVAL